MEIAGIIAFLGFFAFCFLIVFKRIQLLKKGISISSPKQTLKNTLTKVFLILFFLIFTSELLVQSLQFSYSVLPERLQHVWHRTNAIAWLGAFIVVVSVVCMYFALQAFKSSLRFGLNPNNLGKLVTSGIFNYSRNPFFLSIVFLFLGISFVIPTLFFLIIAILSIISIHLFILKEEKFMREKYGEKYLRYAQKVRRYF